MPENTGIPPVVDPDSVPETLCDGPFNLHITGPLACLTFAHARSDPGPMFASGILETKSIVRARIVTTIPNLIALKDLLNRMLVDADSTPPATTGGGTRH
jgi:hypothetical protein